MPAPQPLTQCDPPDLDPTRPDMPAARGFDDIYFSVDGGLEETETVYLQGAGLPERWTGRRRFVIGELGFGTGLNFLAAWRLWDRTAEPGAHLHFISVEKFPFDRDKLAHFLALWPDLSDYAERLISVWPGRVKGVHRLEVSPSVTLTLIHDDVAEALPHITFKADAWFLDGFSPAKNPAMWSSEVMTQVARLSAPGATVGTFTVAGAVRTALSDAGFHVSKQPGFGRKRQRLEAVFPGASNEGVADLRPIIIGGGIAGASVARAFLRRGIRPVIIDPDDGTAASGNPLALVKPRLDLQDHPQSRFFLASWLYACRAYRETEAVMREGIFHASKDDKERARFAKLVANSPLSSDCMTMRTGPYGLAGLHFPTAPVIAPEMALRAFCVGADRIVGRVSAIEQASSGFIVSDETGTNLAEGSHVIGCAGLGIRALTLSKTFGLRYARGQISTVHLDLDTPLTYGGYAVPGGGSAVLGATHKRLDECDPFEPRDEDDVENCTGFEALTGLCPDLIYGASRSAVRVNSRDTLPIMGEVSGGQYVMTALGSRGFCFAPLLGEQMVSEICGDPEPLTGQQKARFQAREISPT